MHAETAPKICITNLPFARLVNHSILAAGEGGVLEVYVVVGSSEEDDSVTITVESELDNDISASLNLTTVRELYRIFIPIALKPE